VRIEQLLDVDAKNIGTAGSRVNSGSAAFGGRRELAGPELKCDDTQGVIVLSKARSPAQAWATRWRKVIFRTPRERVRLLGPAGGQCGEDARPGFRVSRAPGHQRRPMLFRHGRGLL